MEMGEFNENLTNVVVPFKLNVYKKNSTRS